MSPRDRNDLDPAQLEALLDVGRSLVAAHEPETVLRRVLEAAQELTGARYAALGILDSDKVELERFVFAGIDEDLRERIGSLPRGHGILGEVIRHPEPLRLARIGDHPRSYGFPAGHPPMQTFLGVPVMIRGEVYGNLYLTDKAGGVPFEEEDERLAVILGEWTALAIDNARSHASGERRRGELERAMRGLEATVALSRDLGGEVDLERVLELVVKRGRALVDGGSCLVVLEGEEGLAVAAGAGDLTTELVGRKLEGRKGTLSKAVDDGIVRSGAAAIEAVRELGIEGTSAVVVPIHSRGRALGALIAADRIDDRTPLDSDDALALASFATSAATVIATARAAEGERLRLTIAAAEQERQRWARELHDETLQDLGALRVMQESALQRDDEQAARRALRDASAAVANVIEGLQGLITELRPAALDQLGVGPAIEGLADRVRRRSDLLVETDIELGGGEADEPRRFDPAVEATVYRLVQEALTNVVKHAGASRARVAVEAVEDAIVVVVEDDGSGLDAANPTGGFGLIGMRERVELADGQLRLGAGSSGGTRIWASLPAGPTPGQG